MNREILRMEHVSTNAEGYSDLTDFNLNVFENQTVGIVVLNEIGVELLLVLLQNNVPITDGRIYFREKLVNSALGNSSQRNSVVVIDYHSCLVNDLKVLDNIILPMGLNRGLRKGFILPKKQIRRQLLWVISEYGLDINPDLRCSELTERQRCVVEILRAYFCRTRLVVLRGMSEYLSERDQQFIYELIGRMRSSQGMAFLVIMNRYEDSLLRCDKTVLMNNGRDIKMFWKGDREYPLRSHPAPEERKAEASPAGGEVLLSFSDVSSGLIRQMSFQLRKGECLCLCANSDFQAELVSLMRKEISPSEGRICLGGVPLQDISNKALCPGMLMIVRENALRSMLMYDLDYYENLTMFLGRKTGVRFLSRRLRKSIKKEYEKSCGPVVNSSSIYTLSKKEKYSLIYSRVELMHPQMVIIEKPFVDADLQMKQLICEWIGRLKRSGITVMLITVGVFDSTNVADRIIVTHKGKITREYAREEFGSIIL